MKLKLDENLSERGRELLTAAGHDVSTVALQGLQAEADEEVIQVCRKEGRALVTLDLDFANPLRFPPTDYTGIAVLRLPKKATAADLLQAVKSLSQGLAQQPLEGRLWIIEPGRIRVYQPPDAT